MVALADVESTRQALEAALQRIAREKGVEFDEEYTWCDFYLGLSDQYLVYFNEAVEAGDEKAASHYLATSGEYFHKYVNCGDGSAP